MMEPMYKEVIKIFEDFYGEDLVDNPTQNEIIVRFPKVTISNENGESMELKELYVKVVINFTGCIVGTFKIIRSEFTEKEFSYRYVHSHIPAWTGPNIWGNPCLGNGPIRDTIFSLSKEFSESLWKLFCLELSKYVTNESLSGGPYISMHKVLSGTIDINNRINWDSLQYELSPDFKNPILKAFINYVIDNKPFKFSWVNNKYTIAESSMNAAIKLSSLCIKFYNGLSFKEQQEADVKLIKYLSDMCFDVDKTTLILANTIDNTLAENNIINNIQIVLTFKGNPIFLNIIKEERKQAPATYKIFHPRFTNNIIYYLLQKINSSYEPKKQTLASIRKRF